MRRTAAVAAAGAADRIVAVVEAVHTVAAEEAARTAVAEEVGHTAVVEAAGRTAAVEEADRIVAAEALHQHRGNREEVPKEERIDRFEDGIEGWQREAGRWEARILQEHHQERLREHHQLHLERLAQQLISQQDP